MKHITASEIGQAAFCPESLRITKHGGAHSRAAVLRQKHGTSKHEQLNRKVTNKVPCYIASHVFGSDHQITEELRGWRDATLMTRRKGRLFVRLYYATSPIIIRMAGRSAMINNFLRWVITHAHRRLLGG